jgi:hypothetical protein
MCSTYSGEMSSSGFNRQLCALQNWEGCALQLLLDTLCQVIPCKPAVLRFYVPKHINFFLAVHFLVLGICVSTMWWISSFSKMEAGSWMTVQDSTSFWTLASSHCGSSFPKHWMSTHDIYDSHEFVIFEIWVSHSVLESCLQSPRVTALGIETIEK